jgi:hypothetical protein
MANDIIWKNEKRKVSDITPWVKNPRLLTSKQASDLRRSLEKFGYVEPIAINVDGSLIGGHQRMNVLKLAGMKPDDFIEVRVPSRQLDEKEAEELAIRLNRNQGEWSFEMLSNEFEKEDLLEYGFDEYELGLGDAIEANAAATAAAAAGHAEQQQEEEEDSSWQIPDGPFNIRKTADELAPLLPRPKSLEEMAALAINIPQAKCEFNALCGGSKNAGNSISLLFNPHRLAVNCKPHGNVYDALRTDEKFRSLLALLLVKMSKAHMRGIISQLNIGISGYRLANEFRPAIARDIYRRFLADVPAPRILDPSHGWGGRLIGFLAAQLQGSTYYGVDPSIKTSLGVVELFNFLKESGIPGNAFIFNKPFEDMPEDVIEPESFDLVFTSPPYFDTEEYSTEDTQSYIKYPKFDQWVEGFYAPYLTKAISAAKSGAPVVMNVGNKLYPLAKITKKIAEGLGCDIAADEVINVISRKQITGNEEAESLIVIRRK